MSHPGQTPPAPPGGPVYGPWAPGTQPGPTIDDLVRNSYPGSGGTPRSFLTPPGTVPGTAPGGLLTLPGLELPTLDELIAAASTNPREEKRRVDDGSPAELSALAGDFAEAGGDMTRAAEYSALAQRQLAESFGNDGTPVYDQSAHLAALPKNFPDAGPRMISLGTRLADTSTDLLDTQQKAQTTWDTMLAGLDGKAAQLSEHIRAAIDPATGLVPLTAMPGLQANRDTLAAFMQVDVNAAGKTMNTRRMAYQVVARQVLTLLADIGYVPPDNLNAGPSAADDPGQPGGDEYVIGPPTPPPIDYQDGFVHDSKDDASFDDHVSWNWWGAVGTGAGVLRDDLDDATELYAHYRGNSGTPMTVDYEEANREDPQIRQFVDEEIARAQRSIERIHGETGETSFAVTGDRFYPGSGKYPGTENWQKTLGDHSVWGSGDVTIDGTTATAVITVHADDVYDFNPNATDLATGLPDNPNGRFEELGWARPFDVNGTLTRTVTWELGSSAPPVVSDGDPAREPGGEDRLDERGSSRQDGYLQR